MPVFLFFFVIARWLNRTPNKAALHNSPSQKKTNPQSQSRRRTQEPPASKLLSAAQNTFGGFGAKSEYHSAYQNTLITKWPRVNTKPAQLAGTKSDWSDVVFLLQLSSNWFSLEININITSMFHMFVFFLKMHSKLPGKRIFTQE